MTGLVGVLIPAQQRQSVDEVAEALDLGRGHVVAKRSGFLIMLVLSAVIAISGVLADSTATVIGAMIIAPLGTPILGIALGLVTGHLSLVIRSVLWVLAGLAIVVVLGLLFALVVVDPASLESNSQVVGRTSPGLLDLLAALATGTAGAFAMSRRDLSAVLPGVAISISLVPPLGVVGVCVGEGAWDAALGALVLFLSNVFALVVAGSIVFTLAGYTTEPSSVRTARRRSAYAIVAVLTLLIAIPLAANSIVAIALSGWSAAIRDHAVAWIAETPGATIDDVRWTGLTATIDVTTRDGVIPPTADLAAAIGDAVPDSVSIAVDVRITAEYPVR
jgi:uncharacterized hydrophobic protein (TIGR00341 family)